MIYMRNKQTGEVKSVVEQSPEFNGLKLQVDPAGRPLWEQTGAHHAGDVVSRAQNNDLREQDMGEADKPLQPTTNERNYSAELAPHLNLTAAEVASGLTPEKKADEHSEMFSQGGAGQLSDAASRISDASDDPNPSDEQSSSGSGLDDMNKADLKSHAESLGLEVKASETKDDLKSKIAEHEASAGAGGGSSEAPPAS